MDLQTLSVRRGDDLQFRVPVVDQDGVAINITGASMRFTVKKSGRMRMRPL